METCRPPLTKHFTGTSLMDRNTQASSSCSTCSHPLIGARAEGTLGVRNVPDIRYPIGRLDQPAVQQDAVGVDWLTQYLLIAEDDLLPRPVLNPE